MKVNIIGVILFITGVVIMIVGIYSAYQSANYETPIAGDPYASTMDWHMFFMMLPGSVAYGAALIGISEVIRLLHNQHNDKLINSDESVSANSAPAPDEEESVKIWALSEAEEEKVYELYSDKAILEIIPSYKEGYCIIKLQDKEGPLNPYIKIVDVSGPAAEEVQDEPVIQEIMNWYEGKGFQK